MSPPPKSKSPDTQLIDSLVGYNLRRAAARQRERFRSVFSAYDIRPVQLTTLALIYRNDTLRQSALGKALDMKRANVVTLLDQLESRGLVERRPVESDRRSHEIHLTTQGRKLTAKLLDLHSRLEADLAESIGRDELETLVRLLAKLRRASSAPTLD